MKHTYKHNAGFTLIELLVSITIFSIIMVSVITIFIFSANLSAKVDINRAMQENIKNAVETIAENIRKDGIYGVSNTPSDCNDSEGDDNNKLCIKDTDDSLKYSYRLKKNPDDAADIHDPSTMNVVTNMGDCAELASHCVLFRDDDPLTNSFVSFKELNFTLTGDQNNQKKVTINFVLQPAVKKGVRSDLIKGSKIVFQTTLSERLIRSN